MYLYSLKKGVIHSIKYQQPEQKDQHLLDTATKT